MMMNVRYLALACGILGGAAGSATAQDGGYRAWIELQTEGRTLVVKPHCQAGEDAAIRYRLKSMKSGQSGTSRSTQSGSLSLKAHEASMLAELHLGVSAHDHYVLELEIYKGDKRVASDSIVYNAPL